VKEDAEGKDARGRGGSKWWCVRVSRTRRGTGRAAFPPGVDTSLFRFPPHPHPHPRPHPSPARVRPRTHSCNSCSTEKVQTSTHTRTLDSKKYNACGSCAFNVVVRPPGRRVVGCIPSPGARPGARSSSCPAPQRWSGDAGRAGSCRGRPGRGGRADGACVTFSGWGKRVGPSGGVSSHAAALASTPHPHTRPHRSAQVSSPAFAATAAASSYADELQAAVLARGGSLPSLDSSPAVSFIGCGGACAWDKVSGLAP
jgi:hypothetical protein